MGFPPKSSIKALIEHGFLILKASEPVADNIRAVFEAAPPFFRGAPDAKSLNRSPEDMGYRPLGIEYSQSPSYPDQVESFIVSKRAPIAVSNLHSKESVLLNERMLKTFDDLESLAEATTVTLANDISDHPIGDRLKGAFRYWSRLQLNYSRPEEVAWPFINESHEDGNLLTITCATGPGLELQIEQEFLPMRTGPREVLVLAGEIASLLSGGQMNPKFHRVRRHAEINERMALLFFGDIDPDRCQPWFANERNRYIDIGSRVRTSVRRFGLNGFAGE
jgi:isopenicillin N synthase-like dioxygenase